MELVCFTTTFNMEEEKKEETVPLVEDNGTPYASVSQISSRKSSGASSKRSSVASLILEKEQCKIELLAKQHALKKKQSLELARF